MAYEMYRGDSLVLHLLVQQLQYPTLPASQTNPLVPVDLTGAKIWMTAKMNLTDADVDAVFQVTTPTEIVIADDPATGMAKITVPAAATKDVVFTKRNKDGSAQMPLLYDIQVKTQDGVIQTVSSGTLTLLEDVTDAIA